MITLSNEICYIEVIHSLLCFIFLRNSIGVFRYIKHVSIISRLFTGGLNSKLLKEFSGPESREISRSNINIFFSKQSFLRGFAKPTDCPKKVSLTSLGFLD